MTSKLLTAAAALLAASTLLSPSADARGVRFGLGVGVPLGILLAQPTHQHGHYRVERRPVQVDPEELAERRERARRLEMARLRAKAEKAEIEKAEMAKVEAARLAKAEAATAAALQTGSIAPATTAKVAEAAPPKAEAKVEAPKVVAQQEPATPRLSAPAKLTPVSETANAGPMCQKFLPSVGVMMAAPCVE